MATKSKTVAEPLYFAYDTDEGCVIGNSAQPLDVVGELVMEYINQTTVSSEVVCKSIQILELTDFKVRYIKAVEFV